MKRCLAVIVSFLLLAQIFVSCSKTPNNNNDTVVQGDVTAESAGESNEEDNYQKALASLEKSDFEGHVFNVLVRIVDNPEWIIWRNRDIISDEMSGEVINDAVFQRNSYISEIYNCDIAQQQSFDVTGALRISIKSGDNAYDVALPALAGSISNAAEGLFYNLNDIDTLRLESPWWDQNANKTLSIMNKLYFTSGDMLILNNDSTGALVFNKQLVEDWGVENPYELVRDGKWTLDKLYEQISQFGMDLNNDGVMNGKDQYGLMLYADVQHCFYHGAGMDYGTKDAEDIPVMSYDTEKSIEVLTRIFEIMNDKSITYSLHTAYSEFGGSAFVWGENIFQDNRALYYWLRLRDIEGLRTMDADFGILPIPKWDEGQEKYRATVNFYVSCSIAIPVSTYDKELTGIFLEAMNCISKYKLQPAYYDITLTGKYPRDIESADMLDIIFANRVYDIGMFANLGNLTENLKTMLINDDRNFASAFKRFEKVVVKELDKIITKYSKLEY